MPTFPHSPPSEVVDALPPRLAQIVQNPDLIDVSRFDLLNMINTLCSLDDESYKTFRSRLSTLPRNAREDEIIASMGATFDQPRLLNMLVKISKWRLLPRKQLINLVEYFKSRREVLTSLLEEERSAFSSSDADMPLHSIGGFRRRQSKSRHARQRRKTRKTKTHKTYSSPYSHKAPKCYSRLLL